MKHILPFKLFESYSFGEIAKNNPFNVPQKIMDCEPISSIVISDKMNGNNNLDIQYDNNIKIIYNNNQKHILFGEKRLFNRTSFYSVSEFNRFIDDVFNIIYPKFIFDGIYDINDIDIDTPSIDQKYNKTYALYINDIENQKKFIIPYTITRKYNEHTNKYHFSIYIITITPLEDTNRIYDEYIFNYYNSSGDIVFIKKIHIGIKPFINKDTLRIIKNIQANEIISKKYYIKKEEEKRHLEEKEEQKKREKEQIEKEKNKQRIEKTSNIKGNNTDIKKISNILKKR